MLNQYLKGGSLTWTKNFILKMFCLFFADLKIYRDRNIPCKLLFKYFKQLKYLLHKSPYATSGLLRLQYVFWYIIF